MLLAVHNVHCAMLSHNIVFRFFRISCRLDRVLICFLKLVLLFPAQTRVCYNLGYLLRRGCTPANSLRGDKRHAWGTCKSIDVTLQHDGRDLHETCIGETYLYYLKTQLREVDLVAIKRTTPLGYGFFTAMPGNYPCGLVSTCALHSTIANLHCAPPLRVAFPGGHGFLISFSRSRIEGHVLLNWSRQSYHQGYSCKANENAQTESQNWHICVDPRQWWINP